MRNSPLLRYRIPLAVASWLTFVVALIFYWITTDPGASYWDCPEYVTVASKLEVGHPPGNPVWMLAMRVATIPFSPQQHAYVINLFSGLFMAFATFFLCRIIFIPARIYLQGVFFQRKLSPAASDFIAACVSTGSSLCYAFCDSAWYSAIETEVYAMSTFLSALSLWIMMLWWWERSKARQFQLLILLAYILGLSLGVHQLNLLLIPVFAIIILYKKYPRKINPVIVLLVFVVSFALIGLILMVLLPGVLFGAGKFELWAVNGLGLPYNSGVIMFVSLIFILFLILLYLTSFPPKGNFQLFSFNFPIYLWCIAFLLLGFSSFGVILIRAQSAPPMNEGTPDNIFSLASYISRDQYPSTPLLYGHTPYSRAMLEEEFFNGKPFYSRYALKKGKPRYQTVVEDAKLNHRSRMLTRRDSFENASIAERGHGYLLTDYDFKQKLTPELDMWLPRITSRNISDRMAYEDWAGANEKTMLHIPISEALDSLGNPVAKLDEDGNRIPVYSYRPTYYQNLKFFVAYQAYYMYFRYLFWNFIGRQNDFPSMGEIEHGNFITGIPAIDSKFLGATPEMPEELWQNNPGRNRYYGIPFIMGIIGILTLVFSRRRNRRLLTLITVIFLMTGLAIVVYLNQTPGEPRERDYTFLVSYMAFTMWIAAGILGIFSLLIRRLSSKFVISVIFIFSLGIPTLMAIENFDDNDRRGRFETAFYASSILDFEYPSVIFSQGDNHTFPFWYVNEVLGIGEENIPIDITYLSMPTYAVNLKKQGNKSISTIGNINQIGYGKYVLSKIPTDNASIPMPLTDALKVLYSNEEPVWPTSQIIIKGVNGEDYILNLHDLSKGSSFLSFKHLMLLDILASQTDGSTPRILFFPSAIEHSFYKPLEPVLKTALFGKIYATDINDSVAVEILKQSLDRELKKLSDLKTRNSSLVDHYSDPVTSDRSRRYRGELVIAAKELIKHGDIAKASEIVEAIEEYYPYTKLLPGDFTVADSTYHEGKEFSTLLKSMYEFTGDRRYFMSSSLLDSLMENRYKEWLRYYHSLPSEQRSTLSNKSLRMLIKSN